MFERKGLITLKKTAVDEDTLMAMVLDAGAEDLRSDNDIYEIVTSPEKFEDVKKILEEKAIAIENAAVNVAPKNTLRVEGKDAEQLLKLLDELEEHEDVQNVLQILIFRTK